jgi:RNA polymerase sigma factor (sigma-70 family)
MQTLTSPVMATDWRETFLINRDKALTRIYAQTYPLVVHYVKQHNGTAEDAQDLLQEAIIVFYEKVMHEQFNLTSSVSTYIVAICRNQWRQELEKRQRRKKQLPHEMLVSWEEPVSETAAPAQNLLQFVAELGQKCGNILIDFYYTGQAMAHIAEKYQYRNIRTATVQKFKCLERLRKSLTAYKISDFN